MSDFDATLDTIDAVYNEMALGIFAMAIRAACPDAPACYSDLMAAEGAELPKLRRQCESHFNSLSVNVRNAVCGNAISKAQEVAQGPFDRLAANMVASINQAKLDELFPK
jgi:hypothetical protein